MKNRIRKLLENITRQEAFEVVVPERESQGHYSTNLAFRLAKKEKKSLMELAEEVAGRVKRDRRGKIFSRVESALPGFINFWLTKEFLQEELKRVYKDRKDYGQSDIGKKRTIVVEYSSPNIAKPLGVHHLRSTIIGQALVNILRFVGYKTISLSFPGDWGTQFGLLIAGYKRWGDPTKIKKEPINEMLNLYIRFSKAAKEDPRLLDEGREEFSRLEAGDKENRKLWRWFLDESLKDFDRVYQLLGVKIENTVGESYYEPELKSLVEEALARGVAKQGADGSVVIPIPGSSTPEIIRKADGATIFTTRELAAIRHRFRKWKADKILYVTANQQTFHLSQVFRSAELLGYAKPGQLVHVKFGMMLAPGGKKFATREGTLVLLGEVIEKVTDLAYGVVSKKNPDLSEAKKKKVAQTVGVGALKYYDLKENRHSDIVFDWERMLDLKGNSGPYLQYTYARFASILRKSTKSSALGGSASHRGARNSKQKADFKLLQKKEELDLIRKILEFPDAVVGAHDSLLTSNFCNYLYELSALANRFYETTPVLKEGNLALREARLKLIEMTNRVLERGLGLLGIKALDNI